ncbi:MAG: hypothetical protein R2680_01560 [Nitrososphaeraceae archaeon]
MINQKTMPICFSPYQLKVVEDYAKKFKMTSYSQAIEKILSEIKE